MGSVDNRIVNLEMDRSKFTKNVNSAISEMDSLKKSLNFQTSVKGLEALEDASRKVSLETLSDSVLKVNTQFNGLYTVASRVLENIVDSAMNAGKKLYSAMNIDAMRDGFAEYEIKMNSIQTILTNTASKGTTIDEITDALDRLNEYADLTIYNFSDMTRNIGTFTAAGVDLESSVAAIKGLANLAAGVGSTPQQAANAMYQLSQALAAGTINLQDWNSVVNAGMGGEYFQNALKETAIQMGKNIDLSQSFRESISARDGSGWLTADVLLETLKKFADDPALTEAATRVRTITQLIDTMKESAGSGWAKTWELIIGNIDEASEVLTEVSKAFDKIVGSSADARNEMLLFWKENEGRTMAIEGIKNIISGIGSVIEPIKSAYSEIFPKITGEQLVEITKKFKELSESFKLNEETSKKLHDTFQGLFSAIDLGLRGLKSFGNALKGPGNVLLDFLDITLSITAEIGRFITKVNEAEKSSGVFEKIAGRIKGFFDPIKGKISSAVDSVIDGLKKINTFKFEGPSSETISNILERFNKLSERVKDFFSPAEKSISTQVKNILDGIDSVNNTELKGPSDSAIQRITEKLKSVGESIKNVFGDAFNYIFSGSTETKIPFIEKVEISFKSFLSFLKDIGVSIKEVFLEIVDSFDNGFKDMTFADVLEGFKTGVLASLLITLKMFVGDLKDAFGDLELGDKVGKILDNVKNSLKAFQVELKAQALKDIGLAIVEISGALTLLSMLDPVKLSTATVAMVATVVGVSKAITTLGSLNPSLYTNFLAMGTGLVGVGVAIRQMVAVLDDIGEIDSATLAKGLAGLGVILAEIGVMLKIIQPDKEHDMGAIALRTSVALEAIASVVKKLVPVMEEFSSYDFTEIAASLVTLGGMLAEIALFAKTFDGVKIEARTSLAITALAEAIQKLTIPFETMASLDLTSWLQGMATITIELVAITKLAEAVGDKSGFLKASAALIVLAEALKLIGETIADLGDLSLTELAKGLGTLAIALTEIVLAVNSLKGLESGVVHLTVLVAAMKVLGDVILDLSQLQITQVATAVGTLAASLAAIVVAVKAFGNMAFTPLETLSVIILRIGVAAAATGASVLALAKAFEIISKTNYDSSKIEKFGKSIGVVFINAITGALDAVANSVGDFVNLVALIVKAIVDAMLDFVEYLTSVLLRIISAVLAGIKSEIKTITKLLIDIVLEIIDGIAESLEPIVQSILKFVINLIVAVAKGIKDNDEKIIDALEMLLGAVIDLILLVLEKILRLIPGIGDKIGDAIEDVRNDIWNKFSGEESTSVSKRFIDGFSDGIEAATPRLKNVSRELTEEEKKILFSGTVDPIEYGRSLVNGQADGIEEATPRLAASSANAANAVTNSFSGLSDVAKSKGSSFVSSFASGINESAEQPSKAGALLSKHATDALSSGTTKAGEIGTSFSNAFALGIQNETTSDVIKTGSQKLSDYVVEGFQKNTEGIKELGTTIGTAYSTGLEETAPSAQKAALAVSTSTSEGIQEVTEKDYKKYGTTYGESFIAGIRAKKNAAKDAGKEVATGTAEGIRIVSSNEFSTVGSGLVNAFVSSVSAYSSNAMNAGSNIAKNVISGLDSKKSESSTIGNAYGFNFVGGILKRENTDKAVSNSNSLAKMITDTLDKQEHKDRSKTSGTSLIDNFISGFNSRESSFTSSTTKIITSLTTGLASQANLNKASQAAVSIANKIVEGMDSKAPTVATVSNNFVTKFTNQFSESSNVSKITTTGGTIAEKLISGIDSKKSSNITSANNYVKTFTESVSNTSNLTLASNAGATMADKVTAGITSKRTNLSTAGTTLSKDFTSALTTSSNVNEQVRVGTTVGMNVVTGISGAHKTTEGKKGLNGIITDIGKALAEDTQDSKSKTNLANTGKTVGLTIIDAIGGVKKNYSGYSTQLQQWFELGVNTGQGVINGFESKKKDIEKKVKEVVESALKTANNALGIKSPSKKFAEVGRYCCEGLIEGFDQEEQAVDDGVEKFAKSINEKLTEKVDEAIELSNEAIDLNPVIEPTVDLSSVLAAQNEIAALWNSLYLGETLPNSYNATAKILKMQEEAANSANTDTGNKEPNIVNQYSFEQNNYSPKALSRLDIYRQTKNQFSLMKGLSYA